MSITTTCEKHQVTHHFFGGVSKKRCHECVRDEQLDRIEEKLDRLLGAPDEIDRVLEGLREHWRQQKPILTSVP